jgi:hypothetical protein
MHCTAILTAVAANLQSQESKNTHDVSSLKGSSALLNVPAVQCAVVLTAVAAALQEHTQSQMMFRSWKTV